MATYSIEQIRPKVLGSTFSYVEFNLIIEALKDINRQLNDESAADGYSQTVAVRFLTSKDDNSGGDGMVEELPYNMFGVQHLEKDDIYLRETGTLLILLLDDTSNQPFNIGSIIDRIDGWDSVFVAPYTEGVTGLPDTRVDAHLNCQPTSRNLRLEGINSLGGYVVFGAGFDMTYNSIDFTLNKVTLTQDNKIYVADGFRASVYITKDVDMIEKFDNVIDEFVVQDSQGLLDLYMAVNSGICNKDYSGHYLLKDVDNRREFSDKSLINLASLKYTSGLDGDVETQSAFGGIKKGTKISALNGMYISELLDLIFTLPGEYRSKLPSFTYSLNIPEFVIPNESFNVAILTSFDNGSIDENGDGIYDDGIVAGDATSLQMSGKINRTIVMNNNSASDAFSFDFSDLGYKTILLTMNYNQGNTFVAQDGSVPATIEDENGISHANPYPSGSLEKTFGFHVTLPFYYTKNYTSTFEQLPLFDLNSNYVEFTLCPEINGKQRFQIPVTPEVALTKIESYNPINNEWQEEGGVGNSLNYWTTSLKTNPYGLTGAYDYIEYEYNGSDRGSITIRIHI